MKENRCKLYLIDPIEVLAMLNWNKYDSIALPISKNLPEDAYIESINYDLSRACFMARVYHESFDVVKSGVQIPIAKDFLEINRCIISIETYKKALENENI